MLSNRIFLNRAAGGGTLRASSPGHLHLLLPLHAHLDDDPQPVAPDLRAESRMQILQEQLAPLGVELNKEKTRVVDMLKRDAFGS